jgi:hypothetical protein
MADYFSQQPNFVNPSYATPEQLANQRAYAEALTKRSGENVNRPTGALANMITALTAGLERNRANEIQSQAAGQNAGDVSSLIAQLQGGQKIDPQTAGRVYANPMASPEHRALIGALVTPQPIKSEYGQPAYQSPSSGVQPAPIAGQPGNFQPAYRVNQGAEGVHTDAPVAAPGAPIPSTPRVVGDKEAVARGLYPAPQALGSGGGEPTPGAVLPTAPASAVPNRPMNLDELAAKGRQFAAEKERTQGGAKGEAGVIESDVKRAAAAPETLKGLGIMKNTIQSVGDQMTFGPTAKLSNEARRVISNYAPGLVDEKALAGSDAIEKLNLGLAGSLSQQLGLNPSDIYRSVASVPGNEKSKAGTLALINMMEQAARNDQYVGTALYQQHKGDLGGFQQARADYYAHHPIINPITGNAVEIDAKNTSQQQQGGPISVSSPEEARKLPKGTPIRLPDGRTGVVP